MSLLYTLPGVRKKRTSKKTPQQTHYARLSDVSYKDGTIREAYLNRYGLEYDLDKDLSNNETAVLHHKNRKESVIAYRGTASGEDIYSDWRLLTGNEGMTRRFVQSEKTFLDLKKKHPDREVILTGHSLGGSIALDLAKKYPKSEGFRTSAHIYNPGLSVNHLMDSLRGVDTSDIHVYKTGSDITSILGARGFDNVTIVDQSALNSHSLANFLE